MKVKLFVSLLCVRAILLAKAVPEMIYTLSGGTLNPTHSLTLLCSSARSLPLPICTCHRLFETTPARLTHSLWCSSIHWLKQSCSQLSLQRCPSNRRRLRIPATYSTLHPGNPPNERCVRVVFDLAARWVVRCRCHTGNKGALVSLWILARGHRR